MAGHFDAFIIGGFGHVGLPLGIVLADAGFKVALHDTDTTKRARIESGRMPFTEEGAEPVLKRVIGKSLFVADSLADAEFSDAIIVTVGTPMDEHLNPSLLPMLDLASDLLPHLRRNHHLIVRSTVFPGTTSHINEFLIRSGARVHVSYCPERIVQGRAMQELRAIPQIVSGCTDEASHRAEEFFSRLGVPTIAVSVLEAELAKLFTNAWRYIQFAISNQFYMLAASHGADFSRIHHAMTHKYDRAKTFPTPGFAAGPCLLKDTVQLSAFHQNLFILGNAALQINEGLPAFIVEGIRKELGADLTGVRVGILGMAFKADIDDTRDSLSFKLAKLLRFHGAQVICSDEYVGDPSFVSKEDLLAISDIVIVGVPHSAYRGLEIPGEARVIDLWNVVRARRTMPLVANER